MFVIACCIRYSVSVSTDEVASSRTKIAGSDIIDGYDYTRMPVLWLHSNLGYVLQNPHLFSGTIKDNIIYGKLDATEEEIIKASKLVNLHPIVERMEKGYDTQVGEGGSLLSTGEKQLVSFARAIRI
jgi:ATP-binding cassette subfamily B protein